MSEKKRHQQAAMRFLAATLAGSNLFGASAATAVLPEGYAAYSEEGLAAMLQEQMEEAQTAQNGTGDGSDVLPITEQNPDNELDMQADEEQEPSDSRAADTVTVSKAEDDNAVWCSRCYF